jgi:hypothetical protein
MSPSCEIHGEVEHVSYGGKETCLACLQPWLDWGALKAQVVPVTTQVAKVQSRLEEMTSKVLLMSSSR